MTYPTTFSFCPAGTTQQYDMKKAPNHNLWVCNRGGKGYYGATYTAEEIAKHFENGDWEECSFAEEAVKEPDMVFPFTIVTDSDNWYDITEQSSDRVTMTCKQSGEQYYHVTKDLAKSFIKQALWIVTSVGPQKAQEALPSPLSPSSIDITKTSVGSVSKLSIKIGGQDVEEAAEKLERLANAIERVNISLESLQAIIKDFNVNVEIYPKGVV